METLIAEAVKVAVEKHPKTLDKHVEYGTAGMRRKATELDFVMYRLGLLSVLRSRVKKATIGVMITASHNPEEDNGIKLMDPLGEMLEASWEKHATKIVNAKDQDVGTVLRDIVDACQIDMSEKASIFCGRDTRPSSEALAVSLQDGITALGGTFNDYGLVSTPQLHFMVRCHNTGGKYGTSTQEGYYNKLSKAFNILRAKTSTQNNYTAAITVDGANGIGALKLREMVPHLKDTIKLNICNDGSTGRLNHNCGADFVKVQQKAPEGITFEESTRFASFDGDADRIVYFFKNKEGQFKLLDGDKIATLVAGYLKDLVSQAGITCNMGLIQTAYANGSSTKYITETLQVPVACVPTGVKHLHHKAQQYDVGIYFEANGHGTVLFSDSVEEKIRKAAEDESSAVNQRNAAEQLVNVIDLINQTVGDAISDMLLVETVLSAKDWSCEEWNMAYTDLPNRQLKVKVADRTVIQTTDAERQTTAPPGLQEAINETVAKYPSGRSFVRPSGTEDVVRVYAEADTQANTDHLGHQICLLVYKMAGGVGDQPKPLS